MPFLVIDSSVLPAHLVAVHHEVVRGNERFENHDPAVAGRALQQRVCQVGDADVQLIGAVDQVWRTEETRIYQSKWMNKWQPSKDDRNRCVAQRLEIVGDNNLRELTGCNYE